MLDNNDENNNNKLIEMIDDGNKQYKMYNDVINNLLR